MADPFWEKEVYQLGQQLNKYPYDAVVSFLFRHRPAKNIADTHVLEVGCGAGNNLWFAAREGFQVLGIDYSPSAIGYARKRFMEEGLTGEFIISSFLNLDLSEHTFDLIIDRAGLCCISFDECKTVINKLWEHLTADGKLFFSPYSQGHISFAESDARENGMRGNIRKGITNAGDICFYSKEMITELFPPAMWHIEQCTRVEHSDDLQSEQVSHANYEVIVQKRQQGGNQHV